MQASSHGVLRTEVVLLLSTSILHIITPPTGWSKKVECRWFKLYVLWTHANHDHLDGGAVQARSEKFWPQDRRRLRSCGLAWEA